MIKKILLGIAAVALVLICGYLFVTIGIMLATYAGWVYWGELHLLFFLRENYILYNGEKSPILKKEV